MILKRLLCLLYHFSVGAKLARWTEIGTWHASWHATCHANLARNRARARNTTYVHTVQMHVSLLVRTGAKLRILIGSYANVL